MFDGAEDAGYGFEGEGLLAGLCGERLHHATRSVSAGLGRRAVRIQDVDEIGSARRPCIMDRHDLVEASGRRRIQRKGSGGRHAVGTASHIGNDDLVAGAVHLGERGLRSHRTAISIFLGRYMAETARNYQYDGCVQVMAKTPSTTRRKMISTIPIRIRAPVAAAPASAGMPRRLAAAATIRRMTIHFNMGNPQAG